jgi:hypothetical protein
MELGQFPKGELHGQFFQETGMSIVSVIIAMNILILLTVEDIVGTPSSTYR